MTSDDVERPVIIFDGVCNLCNSAVDFVIGRDHDEVFLFTASQDHSGAEILDGVGGRKSRPDSLFLWEGGQLYERSDAVLHIARRLPFPWRVAYAGKVLPRFIRDRLYDWVARNRYRWFGVKDTCRLPTEAERDRFLP